MTSEVPPAKRLKAGPDIVNAALIIEKPSGKKHNLEIVFRSLTFVRELFENCVEPVRNDVILFCEPDRLSLHALGESKCFLVDINIPALCKKILKSYTVSKPAALCIPVKEIIQLLRFTKQDHALCFTASWQLHEAMPSELNITILTQQKKQPAFTLRLLELDHERMDANIKDQHISFAMPSNTFKDIIQNFKKSNTQYIDITVSNDGTVLIKGDNGQTKIEWPLEPRLFENKYEDQRCIDKIKFTTRTLANLVKPAKLVPSVEIILGENMPLFMIYSLDNQYAEAAVKIILAPALDI